MRDPWWPETPVESSARFAWFTLLIAVIGFVLSWIPLIGIFVGHIFGVITVLCGIVAMLRSTTPPMARLAAMGSILLGIVTLILKAIPIINLL
ncbi:hypothetical protein C7445_1318 [Alicyclobacillus sacchari]|uniref:Uncharacterized protein n=1 Tax=Alicyclobacillus sacchari TaxID=392010 RepID=A0A4R8L7Y4_9BACL|nr:hypothetical protein [Alicyclobacillus sacchari]TDY38866.1 hypothetical protein C7445_1318 [Alicyclobacillus sacchari]GMA57305.1 hypothetical protein GCM10025858_18080 [Alicyclobacillus sacchari]